MWLFSKKPKDRKLPQKGEETKAQTYTGGAGFTAIALYGSGLELAKPMEAHYFTYRKMMGNPTIALARSVATAPLRTRSWNVEGAAGVNQDIIDFVDRHISRIWPELLRSLLFSLDFGWQPFEKIWSVGEKGKWVCKLKPLIVDHTSIRLDINDGSFAGIRQHDIELVPNKCYVFTHDQQYDNYYGRARHENCRATAWTAWHHALERYAKYLSKVAGITPQVTYPMGQSPDETGSMQNNFDIAVKILTALGRGDGVAIPDLLPDYIGNNLDIYLRSGADLSKAKAWAISFLEEKTDHSAAFDRALRHFESLMMRAWLVPERVATEGQKGTKAESETHTETALEISDILYEDILRSVNWYIINPLLSYNFGPQYEDQVRIKKGGLAPELHEFYRDVMKQVLGNPINIGYFQKWTKVSQILDELQWPRPEDTEQEESEPETIPQPNLTDRVNKMAKDLVGDKSDKKLAAVPKKSSQKKIKLSLNLSNKIVGCYDFGLFTENASRIARDCAKVSYCVPSSEAFPASRKARIGEGIEGLERISEQEFWSRLDKFDFLYFPDNNCGGLVDKLKEKGYNVAGMGKAERLELDRWKGRQVQKDVGLPTQKTIQVKGLTALRELLQKVENKYVKLSTFRGDIESFRHIDYKKSQPFLDHLAYEMGPSQEDAEFAVEDIIKGIEPGVDSIVFDDENLSPVTVGYELKGVGYVLSVQNYEDVCPQLKSINDALAPVFKRFKTRFFFSTEVMVSDKKKGYLLDYTLRQAAPTVSAIQIELIENFSEVVYGLAIGQKVQPVMSHKYAAATAFQSDWAEKDWLAVTFPKELRQWVKLRMACKYNGNYYAVPGFSSICSVVALGDSVDKVINLCKERCEEVSAHQIEKNLSGLDEIKDAIEKGRKVGVNF